MVGTIYIENNWSDTEAYITEDGEESIVKIHKHFIKEGLLQKLIKSVHVTKRWHHILRRYYMAGRMVFEDCSKFSIVMDASRFQEERMGGLLGAETENGEHKVQWSPPQVCSLVVLPFGGSELKKKIRRSLNSC